MPMLMQCFIHVKVNVIVKKTGLSNWEISVCSTSWNMMMLHFITHFWLCYLSTGCLWKVKTKGKFQTYLALKVVVVTYERRALTRGSKYFDLTRKFLVFWKTGHRGEVVPTGGLTVDNFAVFKIYSAV